jgi:signal transduction histidine kinase
MATEAGREDEAGREVRPVSIGALFPNGVTVDRNIIRLFIATAITCLQLATMMYGGRLLPANLAATAAYVIWAIVWLFPPRYGSPRFYLPLWLGRVVELLLCGVIIATGGPVLIAFLAAAVALFMPPDYIRHITRMTAAKALVIAAVVCAALLLGHRMMPQVMQTPASPIDEAFAALIFSLFAAALSGGKSASSGVSWDDELSHHVAFASKSPAERLLELVAEGISGTAAMIFMSAPDRPISGRVASGGAVDAIDLGESSGQMLWAPLEEQRPFLFDSRTGKCLCGDHRGRIGVRHEAGFKDAWNALFGVASGGAVPIAMGRVRGWLYIVTGQDLSHRSYLELSKAAGDIGAMILRFERFDGWRERTLAEARLLASRDMHDSVLQTLAGLRMQLSSMVKGSENGASEKLNAQMKSLDAIVAAEQQHLRAVLDRSREDAETAAELFSYLEARAQSLARQWNIRCTVQISGESLPVSEETAIECEFLLREAISNAAQHARAEHMHVALSLEDNVLILTIRTEGGPVPGGVRNGDNGLRRPVESRSLRQRVEKLGGTAYLEAVSGGGIVSIQIPLERK